MGFWDDDEDEVAIGPIGGKALEDSYAPLRQTMWQFDTDCQRAQQDLQSAQQSLARAQQELHAAQSSEPVDTTQVRVAQGEVQRCQANVDKAQGLLAFAKQKWAQREGLAR